MFAHPPHKGEGKKDRPRDAVFDLHPSYEQAKRKNLAAHPIFVR
jgi:hypothetical protein